MIELKERTENINLTALIELNKQRHLLTAQQYKTFKGQILAGNAAGALKGITRLLNKKKRK